MTKQKLVPFVSAVLVLTMLLVLVTACGPTPTPEKIVETVVVEKQVTVEVEKEIIVTQEVEVDKEVVVTKEVEVPAQPIETTVVEFWTTDNEEDRVDVYEAVAERYMAEHPEVDIRIVPIDEATVSQRIATAVAANRMPDIIRMGIERVASFAADGILDEEAAAAVIDAVGEDDFRAGPLAMVTNPSTGQYSAVPYDGWIQAIWYRDDVFGEAGLGAPVSLG